MSIVRWANGVQRSMCGLIIVMVGQGDTVPFRSSLTQRRASQVIKRSRCSRVMRAFAVPIRQNDRDRDILIKRSPIWLRRILVAVPVASEFQCQVQTTRRWGLLRIEREAVAAAVDFVVVGKHIDRTELYRTVSRPIDRQSCFKAVLTG